MCVSRLNSGQSDYPLELFKATKSGIIKLTRSRSHIIYPWEFARVKRVSSHDLSTLEVCRVNCEMGTRITREFPGRILSLFEQNCNFLDSDILFALEFIFKQTSIVT